MGTFDGFEDKKDVSFDVVISKDGRVGTRGEAGYDSYVTDDDQEARLDPSKPFGLMAIDPSSTTKGYSSAPA